MSDSYLSTRDQAIIRSIHLLRQLTSTQISRLYFQDNSPVSRSANVRRSLRRLVKWQEIARIEERAIGGWASGSHGYVYVPPKSSPQIRDPHTLAVTELYVRLKEAEAAGGRQVVDYEPEARIKGMTAIPDAEIVLGGGRWVCLEVDHSTESKSRIVAKLEAYEKAYRAWTRPTFPLVLFTTRDDYQQRMIERVIAQSRESELFVVKPFDEAVPFLLS
ncbi:replication-relaxation family protein [Streptomyces sp. NPDC058469]|uniref:replication-relaxation family protein n=1 Tax=Streptomyces sp. NPDC058469 TaxID=3346514 RepID=UPI00365166B0